MRSARAPAVARSAMDCWFRPGSRMGTACRPPAPGHRHIARIGRETGGDAQIVRLPVGRSFALCTARSAVLRNAPSIAVTNTPSSPNSAMDLQQLVTPGRDGHDGHVEIRMARQQRL